ncbi:MAG: autorepressor SdpR family transcription factor [Pseudomonadota bacterium]
MQNQHRFKALADPTRRDILKLLAQRSQSAGDLAAHFEVSKPSLSHHLNALKQADLVRAQRQGQNIIYTINTSVLEDTARFVLDLMNGDENPQMETSHDKDHKFDPTL